MSTDTTEQPTTATEKPEKPKKEKLMAITVERDALLAALSIASGIVERRTTIPILENVLIEANGAIAISATDQEVGVRSVCEGKIKSKGALTIKAGTLVNILKAAASGSITLRGTDNDWIDIEAGASRFKIVGLDPKEFPAMPTAPADVDGFTLSSATLGELIEHTGFAASTDKTRLNLQGLFLEPMDNQVRMTATDGHRLSLHTIPAAGMKTAPSLLLPQKGVACLLKLLEGDTPISFVVAGGVAHADCGNTALSMRLIEDKFPDYNQVIPKSTPHKMVVPAGDLLSALRRVSLVSSERTRGVRLRLQASSLNISSVNPDVGEANENLAVTYDGGKLVIGFNSKLMMDRLHIVPAATVMEIGFTDEVSPVVMKVQGAGDGSVYVVMPMRL